MIDEIIPYLGIKRGRGEIYGVISHLYSKYYEGTYSN